MKKRFKFVILASILLASGVLAIALGNSEKKDKNKTENYGNQNGQVVFVVGNLRLVGNMPFPEIVITDSEKNDWFIYGEEGKRLSDFQGRKLTIKGTASITDMTLANGKKVGKHYSLRDIEVIKIEK